MSTIPNGAATSGTGSSTSATSAVTNPNLNMTPTDFLNMMITQLQHQDPLNPTSSSDLMAQMSQIGQIQSTTTLQTTLQNFGLQTSISSASSLIGKKVTGLDSNSSPLTGTVNSVAVQGNAVTLQLDNGASLQLTAVTSIAPGAATTAGGTATTPTTTVTPPTANSPAAATVTP